MSSAAARRTLMVAFGDLGFALAMFACGLYDAPTWIAGLVAAAMLAYWSASRRRVLNRLPAKAWASQTGIALSVIVAIAVGAYWLGFEVAGAI
ncbi:MAG: hypothetical protein K2P58_12340 [Hyphomonadaceae bacterium]|nr:hypothetical protein [Hyphomonadaceae bacterium]